MILLIDGRNNVYRASYAALKARTKHHPAVTFLRQLAELIQIHKPTAVNIFWDAPRDEVWRKKIHPLYKDRNNSEYIEGLRETVKLIEEASIDILEHLNVRQFYKAHQESDDLIYSSCRILGTSEMVIVSSDSDFAQIPYRMPNVRQYDPTKKEFAPKSERDPAILKALVGDTSDKIDGYYGIGKVRGAALVDSLEKRQQFIIENGRALYYRNILLIDLSLNPKLLHNDAYVLERLSKQPKFDKDGVNSVIDGRKILGAHTEYDRVILPFKAIGAKPRPEPQTETIQSDGSDPGGSS